MSDEPRRTGAALLELVEVMDRLRRECAWTAEQTVALAQEVWVSEDVVLVRRRSKSIVVASEIAWRSFVARLRR